MDNRAQRQDERLLIAERAAEWLMRLQGGGAHHKRGFVRWLRRSPEHVSEVLLSTSTDIVLRQFFRDHPVDPTQLGAIESNVIALDRSIGSPDSSQLRRRRTAWICGVGVGLAAAVTMLFVQPLFVRQWLDPNTYATSIGEQRSVQLADGSAISINAKSSVRVGYSEHARDVYLESGQAMFTVAKDAARPFRVHVSDSVVQAVGTKFDVRLGQDRINVAVVEGTVEISAESAGERTSTTLAQLADRTRVTAGESVVVADTGLITSPAPIDVAQVGAWQQRRLVFRDTPLSEIAEEFARFNRSPHIRVEGATLRARRISGVFDADSPEALLLFFKNDTSVAFERDGDSIVIKPIPIIVQTG
jgi:transmembrane sensor